MLAICWCSLDCSTVSVAVIKRLLFLEVRLHHFQPCTTLTRLSLLGATGKIGDPSGRKTERKMLDHSVIDNNIKQIDKQIQQVFYNHEKLLWNKQQEEELKPLM